MNIQRPSESTSKPRICFVALSCYNLIADRQDIDHIGGAEVQQLLMARWLVEHGFDVSFITFDHGQDCGERIDGIRVVKAYDKNKGLPGIRFFYPRWAGLWSALGRANPDICYQRGASAETGQIALWCRYKKRKFIFGAANDRDLYRHLPFLSRRREKYLFRLGLHLADKVFTQSNNQRSILQDSFGIESTVLQNSGGEVAAARRENYGIRRVLWAGRFIPLKRLEWLLDVAESIPSLQFDVVGSGDARTEYVKNLISRAMTIHNVHLHGNVPYKAMPTYYERCALLCSTSLEEGFPNVYIEAWAAGIPVLTSFDPDGIVQDSGAGWVRQTREEYVEVLHAIYKDPNILENASASARERYNDFHLTSKNMPLFERTLTKLVN